MKGDRTMRKITKKAFLIICSAFLLITAASAVCSAAVVPSGTGFVVEGDANSDGKLNITDLIRCKKYLAGASSEINVAAVDFDLSGDVENNDMVSLRKLLMGISDVSWSNGIY